MFFKIKEVSREMIDYKQLNKYKQYVTLIILFLMQTSSNWYKVSIPWHFRSFNVFLIYLKWMKIVRLWHTALSYDIKVTDFCLMSFHKLKLIILKTGLSKLYMNINNHGIKFEGKHVSSVLIFIFLSTK